MDTLSKSDFEALGCEDVPASQLRARVFQLEGLVAELALTLGEMVGDQDRQGFSGPMVLDRARQVLSDVRAQYDARTNPSPLFHPTQVEFLRKIGVRVEPHTNGDGTPNQAVFNDRADKAEAQLAKLRENLKLIAAIDATLEDHGCDSFVPRWCAAPIR